MSADKYRKRFASYMVPIALNKEFGSQAFVLAF